MSLFCAMMLNIAFSSPWGLANYPVECWSNPSYEPQQEEQQEECATRELFGICGTADTEFNGLFDDLIEIDEAGESLDENY